MLVAEVPGQSPASSSSSKVRCTPQRGAPGHEHPTEPTSTRRQLEPDDVEPEPEPEPVPESVAPPAVVQDMSFPVVEMQQQQQEQEQEQSSNAAAVEEGRRLLARLNTASDAQLARSVCAPLCTRFVTFGYAQKCIKTSAFRV